MDLASGGTDSAERHTVLAEGDDCRSLLADAETPSLDVDYGTDTVTTERLDDTDCLAVDTTVDWQSLLCDARGASVPVVLLADDQTAVCDALDAGVWDCVSTKNPEVERLFVRRVTRAVELSSERHEHERRNEWLDTVLNHSTDSMSVLDENGVALYNTPAVEDQLGYTPRELRGTNVLEHIHPDDRAMVREKFEETVEQPDGTYATAAYRRRNADGDWRWIEAVGNVQFDNPAVGGLIVNRRDVTEREQQRQRLRRQEAYVSSLLDAQPDVFYVLDTNGVFVEWNARLTDVLGYDDESISGMHATEVVVSEDRPAVLDEMAAVYQDKESRQLKTALVTASGETIPYQLNGAPRTDGDGDVVGIVGTGRDISDRVRREERLSVLNRVLRHNLRNRANVVLGHASALSRKLSDEDLCTHAAEIERVASDVDRLGVLTRKVDDALNGSSDPIALGLATATSDALGSLDTDGVTLRTEVPSVTVSAVDAFSAALAELLDNAIRHDPSSEPTVVVTGSTSEATATISVADGGPTIPEQEIAALDGTESPLEHGHGLGLWFVNWVVELSGGELTFDESDLGGNRVSITLDRPGRDTEE
ncbi:MAG: PAS domain S-box protein [Halobaculum sp.]